MPHSFASYRGTGDLNSALVADDSFIANILVLAAIALPIFSGAENRLTEQSVFFRPEPAVVDSFRFGNFSVTPLPNLRGGGEANLE